MIKFNKKKPTTRYQEDFAVANMVTTEDSIWSDVIRARELIGAALRDPKNHRHKYFEFLKNLRDHQGSEYSTQVHQKAARLMTKHKDVD